MPRMSPTRTTPFFENSQTVSFEPPDMRHLPIMVGFPQPAIRHSKTADAIIRKPDICRRKMNRITVGSSSAQLARATFNLAAPSHIVTLFFTLELLH